MSAFGGVVQGNACRSQQSLMVDQLPPSVIESSHFLGASLASTLASRIPTSSSSCVQSSDAITITKVQTPLRHVFEQEQGQPHVDAHGTSSSNVLRSGDSGVFISVANPNKGKLGGSETSEAKQESSSGNNEAEEEEEGSLIMHE